MRDWKKIAIVGGCVFIFSGLILFSFQQSRAAHGDGEIIPRVLPGPFGGKIHKVTSCNCPLPYGKKIEVGPPKGGSSFVVVDGITTLIGIGTRVFERDDIDEGNWVLGLSEIPTIPCTKWEISGIIPIPSCNLKGAGWYVSKIGTE